MIALRVRADELARTDPLTGLANRRALLETMEFRDRGECIGLLMLDIDDFKHVNTEYGHPGGDRALRFVADCLRRTCRSGDLPARLGGDEFAVLVPRAEHDGMAALALRVLEAVRAGDMVRVSVGWAIASGSEKLCTTPTARWPPPSAAARIRRSRLPDQARCWIVSSIGAVLSQSVAAAPWSYMRARQTTDSGKWDVT